MRLAADHLVLARYGREPRAALKTVRPIEDNGGEAHALGADLTSVDNIGELFDLVDTELAEGSLEKLDVLVNNAGISSPGRILNLSSMVT